MTEAADPTPVFRLLIAEDDPQHQHLLQRVLRRSCDNLETVVVDCGHDFRVQLEAGTFDCVVMDYNLPDFQAHDLLQASSVMLGDTPAVIISSSRDQEVVFLCIRQGGVDFVPKAEALRGDVLWNRVHAAIMSHRRSIAQLQSAEIARIQIAQQLEQLQQSHRDLEQHQADTERMSKTLAELNQELAHQARTDPLTQLLNRAAIEECLELENHFASQMGNSYSLILIDIDFFKLYNDTYGHSAGDRCLANVAKAIKHECRDGDYVGRYGGEEIVVLCPGTPMNLAERMADRIRRAVVDLGIVHGSSDASEYVTISLGVAAGPGATWHAVLDEADTALYRSKDAGRNLALSFTG